MNPIRLSSIIQLKRREKGITQEELAAYAGVSKAAVSKWENGQSYPDVSLLPVLASYFNISIDELIGYEPQMTKEDIKKLYLRLTKDFAEKPFDEVYTECCNIISKYYSCFPLILQMGNLLINHGMLANDIEKTKEIMIKAKEMFIRVKEESSNVTMAHQALYMEAYCELYLQNFSTVIHLLGDMDYDMFSFRPLLAKAWAASGNIPQAITALQQAAYLNLLNLYSSQAELLLLPYDPENDIHFEQTVKHLEALETLFRLPELHPSSVLSVSLFIGSSYLLRGNHSKALEYVSKYADLACTLSFPLHLHGDEYFDRLDDWFEDFELGTNTPRDTQLIQKSLLESLTNTPMFTALKDDMNFINIVKKIQDHYNLS